MANQFERWLSKKKNRKILFFIIGAVALFFYVRNRAQQNEPGYGSLRTGYNTGNGQPTTPGGSPGSFQPYTPGNGAVTPKMATFSYPGHINMQWSGSSGNWTFRDLAVVDVPQGYSIRYYIGSGETIITKTPLVGYRWESNFPLTFHKGIIKDGVDDLYFYGTSDQGIARPQDGASMFGNVSFAIQTFYFNRS
ncbi:hypothetical protein [Dyadobacter aurulentus]|uniref:hypothetical protein n=1 Tax=Dyadobacter sp. UC 10 TaxID=2605428 RepID=UPI0011F1C919|nr:hypothetical protein [Dyadobacter sp. UC 10]KAA0992782.1 hypothetical protein FXO21_22685 [Dyadobacter sp. UC 10]